MNGFELIPVGQALKTLAELLEKLRKKPKDQDQVIADSRDAYFDVKEKALELHAENLRLNHEMSVMKDSRAKERAQLEQTHADEIAKIRATYARPKSDELDETAKQMLISLANNDPHNGVTAGELIQVFGLPKAKGDYLFKELRDRKLVASGGGIQGRGMFYHVTDAGTQYLKDHDLLDAIPQKIIPRVSDYLGGYIAGML